MNLPAWATPLDFARTHQTYICDCDYHFPAVATVEVIWLQRVPKRLENKDYHRRYAARKGLKPREEYEELRQWDTVEHRFTFHLCAVCVWYEAEIKGVIKPKDAERITQKLIAEYLEAAAGAVLTPDEARYKNGTAEACYRGKPPVPPQTKPKKERAAKTIAA